MTKQVEITLESPIAMGGKEVNKITLRDPTFKMLENVSLGLFYLGNPTILKNIVPRTSTPVLSKEALNDLDMSQFNALTEGYQLLFEKDDEAFDTDEDYEDDSNTRKITLDKPLNLGGQEITHIVLTAPKVKGLEGVNIEALKMGVPREWAKLASTSFNPPLDRTDLIKLSGADILYISMAFVGFLSPRTAASVQVVPPQGVVPVPKATLVKSPTTETDPTKS